MKNLLLTLTLLFTFSINAQYAVMYAVDLNEGAEQDYLKLEAFWSEIHNLSFMHVIGERKSNVRTNCVILADLEINLPQNLSFKRTLHTS